MDYKVGLGIKIASWEELGLGQGSNSGIEGWRGRGIEGLWGGSETEGHRDKEWYTLILTRTRSRTLTLTLTLTLTEI